MTRARAAAARSTRNATAPRRNEDCMELKTGSLTLLPTGTELATALTFDRVKRSESGMIVNPITLGPSNRIHEAHDLMKKYRISGVPITDDGSKEGRLVGILTNRDLRFETNVNRAIDEVMTKDPLYTVAV